MTIAASTSVSAPRSSSHACRSTSHRAWPSYTTPTLPPRADGQPRPPATSIALPTLSSTSAICSVEQAAAIDDRKTGDKTGVTIDDGTIDVLSEADAHARRHDVMIDETTIVDAERQCETTMYISRLTDRLSSGSLLIPIASTGRRATRP